MREERVHEEWDHEIVQSGHGSQIFYRVFVGTVNWTKSAGKLHVAYAIFMQYGEKIDWQMAAHILEEDYEAVESALRALRLRRTAIR